MGPCATHQLQTMEPALTYDIAHKDETVEEDHVED